MPVPTVAQLIPVLQTAIGPMVLISGMGLLFLTMTNRLGRAIDRARILSGKLPTATEATRPVIEGQMCILWYRARLLRWSILLVALSALTAAVLVIVLFLTALLRIDSAWLIGVLFVICMGCLIAALVFLIRDINLTLDALKVELQAAGLKDV